MHVVVNHLHFRDPVTATTVEATRDAVQRVVDAGGLAARVVRVDETHLILLLDFASPEARTGCRARSGAPGCASTSCPSLPAARSVASAR